MMLSYGNVVLPRYYVITQMEDIAKIVPHLNVPFCFCSSSPLQYEEVVNVSEGSGREAVEAHFLKWGKTILMDVPAKVEASADMVVSCSGKVYTIQSSGGEEFVKSCEKSALCFQKSVLGTHGFARLAFYANAENEACLKSFQLNPSLTALKMSVRDLVDDLAESSVTPEVLFKIVLHEDSRKGYRVCATRHIRKGELVFEDECRSFAMVTREHVRRNWSSEDKKTFSEYAWPLDSEGHLYCIWESDPTRWRPLNHSCEPNCIFEKPHSLNVIAARDIDVSEDITMDYATFCDATMKPFQCLCGSRQCRGLIQPEEGVLESYKGHSWLRKLVNVSSIE
ncbi:SET domain protein [Angomonas deanei]|nr:SET domain protein [Angomonas deanei]|eukprot:EPY35171.1 SET domain protein [Angomonas deanei]